jgi:hypothetical protein
LEPKRGRGEAGPKWGRSGAEVGPKWGPSGAKVGPKWGPGVTMMMVAEARQQRGIDKVNRHPISGSTRWCSRRAHERSRVLETWRPCKSCTFSARFQFATRMHLGAFARHSRGLSVYKCCRMSASGSRVRAQPQRERGGRLRDEESPDRGEGGNRLFRTSTYLIALLR